MHTAHFFMTGGTGLVGMNLIPRLFKFFPDSTMTLLMRGEDEEEVRERLRTIRSRLALENQISDIEERLDAVLGDVAMENCGMTLEQIDAIVRSSTHIIHGAATIRFDHPIEEARMINCGGTRRMLDIAAKAVDNGTLKRFVYIGTSSVSGQRGGTIYEHELEKNQKFFNTYEQSKNESERIVRDAFDRIPSTIFRPSIIIGDSQTGRTSSFNVIYIPLRLVHKGMLTYVPGTPDVKLDLVPIDWVDDVMAYVLTKEESVGKVCHVTAGPDRAATLGEVVLDAVRFFDEYSPLREPRRMDFISREQFEDRRSRMRGREEALMSQLDTLLPYVSVNRLFDSATTDYLLAGSGFTFPRFKDYSAKIFQYCLSTNWGKADSTP